MKPKKDKMYECPTCKTVYTITLYRPPASMPCLNEPLRCPYCPSNQPPERITRTATTRLP